MRAVRRSFDLATVTERCQHLAPADDPIRTPWVPRLLCRPCADDAADRVGVIATSRGWKCPACGRLTKTFIVRPIYWSRSGLGLMVATCGDCAGADRANDRPRWAA
jgi:hypothetical protein